MVEVNGRHALPAWSDAGPIPPASQALVKKSEKIKVTCKLKKHTVTHARPPGSVVASRVGSKWTPAHLQHGYAV